MFCQTPVVVALDFEHKHEALNLVSQLDPALCRLKVGKELFTRGGPQLVQGLQQRGFELFLTQGCSSCHRVGERDALFTDQRFHNVGVQMRSEASRQRDLDIEARLRGSGTQIHALSDAEKRRWAELVKDLPGRAAKELDAKGQPATQVLKTYVRFLEEAGYKFPIAYPL